METKVNHTILAYLLALQDLPNALSKQEQAQLKEVAKELKTQPKAWQSYIEPSLIEIIQGNAELNQSFQLYLGKLNELGEIPRDLLPKSEEIKQLVDNQSSFLKKGFIPDTAASGYEQQLNNVVIVINQTDKPEETVKQLGFLDKMKQYLKQDSL